MSEKSRINTCGGFFFENLYKEPANSRKLLILTWLKFIYDDIDFKYNILLKDTVTRMFL